MNPRRTIGWPVVLLCLVFATFFVFFFRDPERLAPSHGDNVVLSPHLGYVTQENFRGSYGGVVEDIRAFLDGKPIRLLQPA